MLSRATQRSGSRTAIVFDLDGTLVDSAPDIHAATNRMLAELDQPPLDLRTIIGFIGHGVPKLVERVMQARDLRPQRHDELVEVFMNHYSAAPANLTQPYQDVRAALDTLVADGHALGVCTNKPGALARDVLGNAGLAHYFDVVLGGDEVPAKKPDADPLLEVFRRLSGTAVAYVGDSVVDAETARRAEVPFLLFSGGYRDRPADQVDASAVFDRFSGLPELIRAALPS